VGLELLRIFPALEFVVSDDLGVVERSFLFLSFSLYSRFRVEAYLGIGIALDLIA